MPLKSVNFLIITSLYAQNLSKMEIKIYQLTDTQTPNWSLQISKVVFSTELVVILMYTWEECAGNQSNFNKKKLLVGSSETTCEAPYI